MAAPSVTLLAGTGSTTNATSYATASVSAPVGSLVLVWFVHGRTGAVPSAATSVAGASITGAVSISSITFDTVASALSRLECWAATATGSAGAITITLPETQSGCVWSVQRVANANTAVGTLGIRQAVTNRGDAGTTFAAALATFTDPENFVVQAAGFTDSLSTPKAGFVELTDAAIATPTLSLSSSWRDASTDLAPSTLLDSSVVWPDATNSGIQVATTTTHGGGAFTTPAELVAAGATGAGTSGSPYLFDRFLFTDIVLLGGWDEPNPLVGKWVKFTNCRFYGNPGGGGGSAYLWVRQLGPDFVIIEDSSLGPNASVWPILGTGGTEAGTDKGLYSYSGFRMTRCNVWGTNVCVGFETEQSELTSTIEDSFLHDIYSGPGDHTDIINGNAHASNIVARHNMMDGIRTGGAWVTNGFGIYDDPYPAPQGIIKNWTIDNNYITRCNWQLLASTIAGRFLDPFVVTNNVWTDQYQSGHFNARTPSTQFGNADQNGVLITF